jgi:hypothetical protein
MKKKVDENMDYWDDTEIPGITGPESILSEFELPVIVQVIQESKQYYHPAKWKGIVDTYQCDFCGHCDQIKDNMILHVLKHVQESEREELFNKLIKE